MANSKQSNGKPQMNWLIMTVVVIVFFSVFSPIVIIIFAMVNPSAASIVTSIVALGIEGILAFAKPAEPIRNAFVDIIKRFTDKGILDPPKTVSTDYTFWENFFEFSTERRERLKNTDAEMYAHDSRHETLKFLAEVLCDSISNVRYELSIFQNPDHPEICCYYDTDRNPEPDSQIRRKDNPDFYISNKYAVVELLKHPSNNPRIIRDIAEYTDERQESQVKEIFMFCFDTKKDDPLVLVIACDQKNVFKKRRGDGFQNRLIRTFGAMLHADRYIGEKLCNNKLTDNCKGNNDAVTQSPFQIMSTACENL